MIKQTRAQQANLGCGTLILIAIIVVIFSRPGIDDLEREIQLTRTEITSLKQMAENQTNEIKLLRALIEQSKNN